MDQALATWWAISIAVVVLVPTAITVVLLGQYGVLCRLGRHLHHCGKKASCIEAGVKPDA